MHTALERFSIELEKNDLTWDSLSDEERDRLILSCLEDAAGDYGNSILESNARNAYMKKRAQRILKRTVWALQKQLSGSDFAPEGFEVAFGGGRIDRLDILKENGKVYVKIIDYKTGNTTFDLTRVYYGLQLQLMIYLDAALQVEKKRHPEAEIIPAFRFSGYGGERARRRAVEGIQDERTGLGGPGDHPADGCLRKGDSCRV